MPCHTAAFRGALTTSEDREMPADQLADTISGMSVDECALMDRIATGDPGALETLYYRFHPKLARFLWRLIGRREGLEEIINVTFWMCVSHTAMRSRICVSNGVLRLGTTCSIRPSKPKML